MTPPPCFTGGTFSTLFTRFLSPNRGQRRNNNAALHRTLLSRSPVVIVISPDGRRTTMVIYNTSLVAPLPPLLLAGGRRRIITGGREKREKGGSIHAFLCRTGSNKKVPLLGDLFLGCSSVCLFYFWVFERRVRLEGWFGFGARSPSPVASVRRLDEVPH